MDTLTELIQAVAMRNDLEDTDLMKVGHDLAALHTQLLHQCGQMKTISDMPTPEQRSITQRIGTCTDNLRVIIEALEARHYRWSHKKQRWVVRKKQ